MTTIPFDTDFFKEMTVGNGVAVYMFDNCVGFTSAKNPVTYFEARAIDPSLVEYTWEKIDYSLDKNPSFIIPKISLTTFRALCESSFNNTVGLGGTAKDFTSRLEIRLKKLLNHPPFYITSCCVQDTSCDCRSVYNSLKENGFDADNMTCDQARDAYDTLRKTKPHYKRFIPI